MGIKTVPLPPYSPDVGPCDFWLFPKLRGCRYETNERGCDEGYWHAHTRGLSWGLPEVVGTVQQVHCSQRRLLRRGLEFHVCTINKSAHTKKSGNLSYVPRIYCLMIKMHFTLIDIKILTMKYCLTTEKAVNYQLWCTCVIFHLLTA